MKSFIRFSLYLVVFFAVIAGAIGSWGYLTLQAALNQTLRLEVVDVLEVPPGSTPARVFVGLEQRGTIERAQWVRRYWQWRLSGAVLQVGEYRLEPGMDVRALLQRLQRGEVIQRSITLVEGWNFSQFRDALARAERLEQTLPREWSNQRVAAELELSEAHPEGLFLSGHLSVHPGHVRPGRSAPSTPAHAAGAG